MKNSTSTTMRRIAGALFGVLFVYGTVCMKFLIEGAGIGNAVFTWTLEVGLLVLSAVFASWLLAKDDELSPVVRRGVPVAAALVVLFQLITFESQTTAINYTLSAWFPGDGMTQPEFGIWKFVILGVKLMLVILAAFFVSCAKNDSDDVEDLQEEDEIIEEEPVVEAAVETITEELEKE